MTFADLINGLFEAFGAVAVLLSCIRVLKDKRVAGVSLVTIAFFTTWGIWNLYYYPSLGQTFSGVAAGCVCLANLFWCSLIWKYRARPEASTLPFVRGNSGQTAVEYLLIVVVCAVAAMTLRHVCGF